VFAFAMAFFANSATSTLIRGRLEGAVAAPTSGLEAPAAAPLRDVRKKGLGILQAVTSGSYLERLERDLRLAESQLQPVDFIAIRIALAGLAFAVPFLLLSGVIGMLAAIAAAIVGFFAPGWWLKNRKDTRANKLEQQLPEALTFIANSLKAGFGLLQALSMAADQLEHPIASEFAQTVHETNVGSSMEEAFIQLGERCVSYDVDMVVTAILIQRTAGGNLAEILENVSETMRERVRIKGEINTLTAQQKLTGIVIALLPVGVGAMFMVVSPEYITVLFTETMGQVMLGAALFLEAVGILIIRRILDIEV
jgi:tight adherence protein B